MDETLSHLDNMNNAGGIKDMAIEEWHQDDIRFQIWDDGGTLDQVSQAVKELGWEAGDEIIVKIAASLALAPGMISRCAQSDHFEAFAYRQNFCCARYR